MVAGLSNNKITPEQKAREKIDAMLADAGWSVVNRDGFTNSINALAVRENLLKGNLEADYILYLDGKAVGVIEAKRSENNLGADVASQAENYAKNLSGWVQYWAKPLPFIFLSNGDDLLFRDLRSDEEYVSLKKMLTPKEIVVKSGGVVNSEYAKLPSLPPVGPKGLRECQFEAISNLELSFKQGKTKALVVLATGAGKTFTACTACYRLLNYTSAKRVLFLVDRNNLGKQAESEFKTYRLTESGNIFSDDYVVQRLTSIDTLGRANVVISTIQRLFAVLTGKTISDLDDNEEGDEEHEVGVIKPIGENTTMPKDFFDCIVIDECHRSIYGDWKAVLDYFSSAKIIGLTATPTAESLAFFNNNRVVNYTLEKSVADGVNVPPRVFRIRTQITEQGGIINSGETIQRFSNFTNQSQTKKQANEKEYKNTDLDRSVVVPSQIETIVRAYKDAIYTTLYPERNKDWSMIPKTLFFAKNERHADNILEAVKKVFADEFSSGLPDNFVQKITCTQADTNALIREFRNSKDFRIAITVTLVATGTDVKPLEVLVFMRDIDSQVLYTQMKGRGCRTINDDALRNVTTNATSKDFYYLIDAVGVTEHEKSMPSVTTSSGDAKKVLSLKDLIEHLAHGDVSDENLNLFMGYLSKINKKAKTDDLEELNSLLTPSSLREIITGLSGALSGDNNTVLPEFVDINNSNTERKLLISGLVDNTKARLKLLEINAGFLTKAYTQTDTVIYSGFSKEQSKEYVDLFEKYINDNRDEIEALRILYNNQNIAITYSMLKELEKKLVAHNSNLKANYLWSCYEILDAEKGCVKPLNKDSEFDCLTNLIQLVRYGYGHILELISLRRKFGSYFELYCGQKQKSFTADEVQVVRQIAEYIVQNGCFDGEDKLFNYNRDLFLKAAKIFPADKFDTELLTISKYIFYGKAA